MASMGFARGCALLLGPATSAKVLDARAVQIRRSRALGIASVRPLGYERMVSPGGFLDTDTTSQPGIIQAYQRP
jgi:hypothetical protein